MKKPVIKTEVGRTTSASPSIQSIPRKKLSLKGITSKHGLLYRKGKVVSVEEADRIAHSHNLHSAEVLQRSIQKKQDEKAKARREARKLIPKKPERTRQLPSHGKRIRIPACEIELIRGGNTIWVHSAKGATIMRIKTANAITVEMCGDSPVSHTDLMVQESIHFCLGPDAKF